jgi:SAM-dependent methyltransferase
MTAPVPDRATVPRAVVEEIRSTRRHPRATQFDYLHVRGLVDDLGEAINGLEAEPRDVLDVYCGTRPYDDLFPATSEIVGLDVEDRFGVADVVSSEFLPFPADSFDMVLCTQAFYYVEEPAEAVAEIRRVLRPGGTVLITLPVVWEYDTRTLEHRFTEPGLARLFAGWEEVQIVENGGWGVSWAAVTGSLFHRVEERLAGRRLLRSLAHPLFAGLYLGINGIGLLLEAIDRRFVHGPMRLPMNLLLTARRPVEVDRRP